MLSRRAVAVGQASSARDHALRLDAPSAGLRPEVLRRRYLQYAPYKRAFDVVNAALQLIIFSPLFLLSAVAIKLTDRGPVFFRQPRLTGGPNGAREFMILKFRTMVVNAESLGAKITQRRDPRITAVGRVLRWLKLDELPQLLNILRGEMSFVGPRPQTMGYVAHFREHYEAIHSIVPAGLTDLASLKYRDEAQLLEGAEDKERFYIDEIMPDKLALHYEYLSRIGFGQDFSILASTVFYVFIERPYARIMRWVNHG